MLPFEDIKVVDFSQRLPGPYCSSILADLGAKVVMVEKSGNIPETRTVFPGLFELVNRNKRSMTLNLKSDGGKMIAEKLIRGCDVFIEEFRPGVAERLGIGYDQVKHINPSIIYCSISGFGQDGPYRDRVGHDINYLSLSGILSLPGQPDTPPSRPGVPLVDLTSGMYAAIAIMSAIRKRDREGTGEYIDISMQDCMVSWMSTRAGRHLVYGEKTEHEHLSPLNNIYETKDGKNISLGMLEEHFWRNFCEAMGKEELLEDARFSSPSRRKNNSKDLLLILKKIISQHTRAELDRILNWKQIPYAPILSAEEALNDPHVKARNLFQEIEAGGLGRIREVVFPAIFSGTRIEIKTPPPAWGQHTDEILRETGYTDKEISLFRNNAVI
ncbi:MAG TPA: CaiB/BaiF CoA-transferase family protein [Syntrophales bacterium]|nr:CaiB/BaiF CoA-transferase family protein [Syntrophales bacterium]